MRNLWTLAVAAILVLTTGCIVELSVVDGPDSATPEDAAGGADAAPQIDAAPELCGNGVIDDDETCDGTDLDQNDCTTIGLGFLSGRVVCNTACDGWDTTDCVGGPELNWITIDGGTFDMGSTEGTSYEVPVHAVSIRTFQLTKTEVTVIQYQACMDDGVCTDPDLAAVCHWNDAGYDDHPVDCVNWSQARAFCQWSLGRLASEAEWEFAARSRGLNIKYPWGDEPATCDFAVMLDGAYGCGLGHTDVVCSRVAGNTNQGLCDMTGNVVEWVEDNWHGDYQGAPTDEIAWISWPASTTRVTRSSAFDWSQDLSHVTFRSPGEEAFIAPGVGFRCARNVD